MAQPLPAETRYWSRSDDRQRVVNALFNRSACHYDRICRLMSCGSGQRYRRDALRRAGVQRGMCVLDVGIGTGLLAREILDLTGPSGRVVGIDPSPAMMAIAHEQLAVGLVQGIGDRLPFGDASFDFVTMGYALRHVADLDAAFDEYRRVLRAGGRLLLLEITPPESTLGLALARTYFGSLVPLVVRIATRDSAAADLMRFFWDSIALCVPPDAVLASLRRAGFAAARRSVVHGVFSEYTVGTTHSHE